MTTRRVGFTGTSRGMSRGQRERVADWLRLLRKDGAREFHHGDCVGADAQAVTIAKRLGYRIVSHPSDNIKQRAFTPADDTRPARPYLKRDQDIVDEADVLIAAPKTDVEQRRSGTWATVRRARTKGIAIWQAPRGRQT